MSTILQRAEHLVHGNRGMDYGHPYDDFSRTAALWTAAFGYEFEPEDIPLAMILLKISRERNSHKTDNVVDIAGYAETLGMVWNVKAPTVKSGEEFMIRADLEYPLYDPPGPLQSLVGGKPSPASVYAAQTQLSWDDVPPEEDESSKSSTLKEFLSASKGLHQEVEPKPEPDTSSDIPEWLARVPKYEELPEPIRRWLESILSVQKSESL